MKRYTHKKHLHRINTKLSIGKYKGFTLNEVREVDEKYYKWLRAQYWFQVIP